MKLKQDELTSVYSRYLNLNLKHLGKDLKFKVTSNLYLNVSSLSLSIPNKPILNN